MANLVGGDGNDTIVSEVSGDVADGGAGDDTIVLLRQSSTEDFFFSSSDLASGADVSLGDGTILKSFEQFILLTGSGADTLSLTGALVGGNRFDAGSGTNRVVGDFSSLTTSVFLNSNSGQGNLQAGGSLAFEGVQEFSIRGGAATDFLGGGNGSDFLDGGGGDDFVFASSGNDTAWGGDGDDSVVSFVETFGESSQHNLDGGAGVDTLGFERRVSDTSFSINTAALAAGVALADGTFARNFEKFNVALGSGSDTLTLDAVVIGDNAFFAGDGIDRLVANFSAESASLFLSSFGLFSANFSVTLGQVEEFHIAGGSGADTFLGASGDDVLSGGGGDDLIVGSGGADHLIGGDGVDTLDYGQSSEAVLVNLGTGIGIGGDAQGDTISGFEILLGTFLADTFIGSDRDDTLNGGGGADSMAGGRGNDFYVVSETDDIVEELSEQGIDTVLSHADFTLAANLENLNLAVSGVGPESDAAINGTGNELANVLSGNGAANVLRGEGGADTLNGEEGDDTLIGGAGADTIDGGDGNDTISYQSSRSGVDIRLFSNHASGGDASGDTFAYIENIIGSSRKDKLSGDDGANSIWGGGGEDRITGRSGADRLFGDGGDDDLFGGGGDDVLSGGAGRDFLDGGRGSDTADYSASASAVRVNLRTGSVAGGDAMGDTLVSIENVIGSAGSDTIVGKNNSDNVIDGGAGADTLAGGSGDDTFVFGAGEAHGDIVLDFSSNRRGGDDILVFQGYGTAAEGATFVQIDAAHWQITSADGLIQDLITFANCAYISADDYYFG